MFKNVMKNNACDDLRFSVVIYIITTKDYSWGNEIIMGRIEKKWVFRVGSEKHEADNCVIVNLSWEDGRQEKINRMSNMGLWKGSESGSAYSQV